MKGLLIKDWKLMKNQAGFFVMILVISVACSATMENPFFAMGYATSFVSIFAISTISYDEYDNGMPFLFTLPISKKMYVKEKYLFAFVLAFASLIISAILSAISAVVMEINYTIDDWVMIITLSLAVVLFLFSIMLPARMKYSADKHRMVILIVFGIIAAVVGVIYGICAGLGMEVEQFAENVLFANVWIPLVAVIVVGIIFVSLSYGISVKIMEKKEF